MAQRFMAVTNDRTIHHFPCWDEARDFLRRHGGKGVITRRAARWTGERWVWRTVLLERVPAA